MLTDLRRFWQLLWLDGSTLLAHTFTSRSLAVGFIEDFLARPSKASEGVHPVAARFAKRRKIGGRLLASREGPDSAAFEEQLESLEGLVEPSELMQMRADFWLRQLVNSPCAASRRPLPEESQPPEESLPPEGLHA